MDKISNLLISLKNGGNAGKDTAVMPYSKALAAIAKTLFDAGYIASYKKITKQGHDALELGIAYTNGMPRDNARRSINVMSEYLSVVLNLKQNTQVSGVHPWYNVESSMKSRRPMFIEYTPGQYRSTSLDKSTSSFKLKVSFSLLSTMKRVTTEFITRFVPDTPVYIPLNSSMMLPAKIGTPIGILANHFSSAGKSNSVLRFVRRM
jgi:ribosomal protein S8